MSLFSKNGTVESLCKGPYGEDSLTFDNAEKRCPEGYKIVASDDHMLQLDYDSPTLPDDFDKHLTMFQMRIRSFRWWRTVSKSGNTHVTIQWPEGAPMPIMERIAWQAVFGSDPRRETLSLLRLSRGLPNPIVFFEKNNSEPIMIHEVSEDGRMFRGDND